MSNESSSPSSGVPRAGAEHARLKPLEGRFRATVTLFMSPEQTLESTGTMVNTFQLDGLYLHQDYVGDPSSGPYPRFVGKGYWGFDVTRQRYEGFWIDNASTTMQRESGHVDPTGRIWTMVGEVTHPASGEKLTKRSVITLLDDDHHQMEQFVVRADGSELRTMRIVYARATASALG